MRNSNNGIQPPNNPRFIRTPPHRKKHAQKTHKSIQHALTYCNLCNHTNNRHFTLKQMNIERTFEKVESELDKWIDCLIDLKIKLKSQGMITDERLEQRVNKAKGVVKSLKEELKTL